jgi:hypothetical protein
MTANLVFLILAVVSFALAACRVQSPVEFRDLGFMFTVLMIGM